jgi:hypothetical protein
MKNSFLMTPPAARWFLISWHDGMSLLGGCHPANDIESRHIFPLAVAAPALYSGPACRYTDASVSGGGIGAYGDAQVANS